MQKLRMNRRAVSPIIATLLLVAIAVAAAVITYTWIMTLTANQSQQAQTNVKVDMVFFGQNSTRNATLVAIRNIGSVPATIQTIMLYNVSSALIFNVNNQEIIIPPQDVLYVGVTDAAAWVSGSFTSGGLPIPDPDATITGITYQKALEESKPYFLRVVTSSGFVMEGTYYTPAAF